MIAKITPCHVSISPLFDQSAPGRLPVHRHAWPRSHACRRGSRPADKYATAGHYPRGIEPRATPFNTKHLFLISPELVNQFILILILIRRPRRIAMLILDPGTLDFLAPSINYN
jgi:hypothetical protein